MDKEAFLHQLESSAINKDKRLFAKTIYNLPADVIVGFTKEEFSRIIYISHQFSSQKMDRLCNFLEIKGSSFLKNALKGINELNNSLLSKFYYSIFISLCETDKEKVKIALGNNAIVCIMLAEMGVDSKENLEIAICSCRTAQEIFPKTSVNYISVLTNEGNARVRLAEMGIASREHLETAIHLYGLSQKIFPKTSVDYARVLINESNARKMLAEMGIASRENLETAVNLCGIVQKIFSKTSTDYACALINEGSARKTLAEMGFDSRENLKTAIYLYGLSQEIFPEKSIDHARVLMNEGNARELLAKMGVDSRANLETVVHLCETSSEIFPKTGVDYARALMNKGNALKSLAEMDFDSKINLETAIHLYELSQEIFPKTSTDYACALMNEGNARVLLAKMGIGSRVNLETAIHLCETAHEISPKTSVDYARALMNEGNARVLLAKMNVDSHENFERSQKLYLESISIFEELGDGWTYSLALLNLSSLLKNKFFKTGDKKYLEELEIYLSDVEEKIRDRNIRYKEFVMARVHEIRANLLEFEGKSGIYSASREYDKAYEFSRYPFHKFMDEFCQARNGIKSFCELVSDWKEIEKEYIFLDYYDYAIFECHLENALKSTVNEEDELKLAVEKLKEIRDRTQIKIIKDRVSAYIHLLQALVDCFNNDSYKEAAENVKEGCKIFSKHGDKQGQQMCEIFHNAVVKKRDPDAWQEIIRNREFSSNFYNLLCEYSDRKRADMESYKLSQIYQTVNRTEKIVDQLQETLNQEFAEIKDQIIIGFKGSDSEFREIKKMIISIQQDFEYLTQVSSKFSNEEEEAIKIFMVKMLEMIKNGDPEKLSLFLEDIIKNEHSLEEIIEKSKASEREKANAKSKLADLKKMPGILKEKMKSFSVDVTKEVIVNLTAGEIITLLTPVLSTATFGVPIPSKVVEMLLEVMKDS